MKVKKKKAIQTLSRFGAVCYYDELTRFKASAAAKTSGLSSSCALRHFSTGLVQGLADNFDCTISSANGFCQTHSLALMMIQSGEGEEEETDDIPRVKKKDMKNLDLADATVIEYQGPSKPDMPGQCAVQQVQSEEDLEKTA